MTEQVEVSYAMSDGTIVVDGPFRADRATVQVFRDGLAVVHLFRTGNDRAEVIVYRQVDRVRRVFDSSAGEDS